MLFKVGGYKQGQLIPSASFDNAKSSFIKYAAGSNEHIITEYTPLSFQLNQDCVSNSICDALEILMGQQNNVVQLSRLFVYWNARLYTKDTKKDEGTYIKNAFDSLCQYGVCSEELWKYSTNVFNPPSLYAYIKANDNIIPSNSYYNITSDNSKRLDDIEIAIRSNHPVCFGTLVSEDFASYYGNDRIFQNANGNNQLAHAMIITGVRDNNSRREFYIRNSWGETWGDNGHVWLDQEYLMADYSNDFWVCSLLPELIL